MIVPAPASGPGAIAGRLRGVAAVGVMAVAIAVVALIMLKLGRGPATFMVALIVGVAAFELYEAFRRAGYHPAGAVEMNCLLMRLNDERAFAAADQTDIKRSLRHNCSPVIVLCSSLSPIFVLCLPAG